MPAHEPGLIHPWVYGQGDVWVDVHGREHLIGFLDQDYAENILLYMLRNAVRIRNICLRDIDGVTPEIGWSSRNSAAKHWMLRTPTAIAVMRRLLNIQKRLYGGR